MRAEPEHGWENILKCQIWPQLSCYGGDRDKPKGLGYPRSSSEWRQPEAKGKDSLSSFFEESNGPVVAVNPLERTNLKWGEICYTPICELFINYLRRKKQNKTYRLDWEEKNLSDTVLFKSLWSLINRKIKSMSFLHYLK